jgi:trk system potassium uptake protein TrkA
MKITIVGCGKKVVFLVESLLQKHHSLTVINFDKAECIEFSHIFENVTIIHGDGSKPFVLKEAEVENCDLMIAITNTDADNLVICQLAKKVFGIKRAFATVNDPTNVYVFKRMGINTAVSATRVMAEIIGQMASVDDQVTGYPIGKT